MVLHLFNHCLELVCLILVLLCMLAAAKKRFRLKPNSFLSKAVRFHDGYAYALVVLALAHGILSGKAAAMMSGKLAWLVLLVLIVFALIQKKCGAAWMKKAHVVLSVIFCLGVIGHVIHAILS